MLKIFSCAQHINTFMSLAYKHTYILSLDLLYLLNFEIYIFQIKCSVRYTVCRYFLWVCSLVFGLLTVFADQKLFFFFTKPSGSFFFLWSIILVSSLRTLPQLQFISNILAAIHFKVFCKYEVQWSSFLLMVCFLFLFSYKYPIIETMILKRLSFIHCIMFVPVS